MSIIFFPNIFYPVLIVKIIGFIIIIFLQLLKFSIQ